MFLILTSLSLVLIACKDRSSGELFEETPQEYSITTQVTYYADINEEEKLSTDVFPMNKNIYVVVKINTVNPSEETQQLSLVVTIPRSEGIEVRQGPSKYDAKIEKIDDISGVESTRISGINYLVYEGAQTESFTFVIQGISYGTSKMEMKFDGNARENDKAYYVSFQFVDNLEIEQLILPTYEINENTITWAHDSTEDYMFYLNHESNNVIENQSYKNTTFDLSSLDAGAYTIELIAKGNGITYRDSNPRIIEFSILDKPKVTLQLNQITWEPVANASGYQVEINDSVFTTSNLYFDMPTSILINGVNDISVKAISNDEQVIDIHKVSDTSVIKLIAPFITESGSRIVWSAINSASSYDVYVDGIFYTNTTALQVTKPAGGEYTVTVVAKGNQIYTYDSLVSNSITYQLG